METKYKQFKENPDGSITVEGKRLTPNQFVKLGKLMPEVKWIGFCFLRPEDVLNDTYTPTADQAAFNENYARDPSKFVVFKRPNKGQSSIVDNEDADSINSLNPN